MQSKLLRGMSAEQMQALRESRIEAQKEISRERAGQSSPLIVFCLRDPNCVVAIARVTAVVPKPPEAGAAGTNLQVDLELEHMLRGTSEKTHVITESRWRPIKSGYRFGHIDTALDREEPTVGKHYVIGYRPPGYGDDGTKIDVGGAIDLKETGEAGDLCRRSALSSALRPPATRSTSRRSLRRSTILSAGFVTLPRIGWPNPTAVMFRPPAATSSSHTPASFFKAAARVNASMHLNGCGRWSPRRVCTSNRRQSPTTDFANSFNLPLQILTLPLATWRSNTFRNGNSYAAANPGTASNSPWQFASRQFGTMQR